MRGSTVLFPDSLFLEESVEFSVNSGYDVSEIFGVFDKVDLVHIDDQEVSFVIVMNPSLITCPE